MASSIEREAQCAAVELRDGHGDAPIHDLLSFIEDRLDADISAVSSSAGEHGLTVKDEVTGSLHIAVQATAHHMRWRSNLAHEAAHAYFRDWDPSLGAEPSARTPSEIRADAFARHLLIPESGLIRLAERGVRFLDHGQVSLDGLSRVVRMYRVSPQMAMIALKQCGLIDEGAFEACPRITTRGLAIRYGWQAEYDALSAESAAIRPPRKLLERALKAYAEGFVSIEQIAHLRNVPVEQARADVLEAGLPVQR